MKKNLLKSSLLFVLFAVFGFDSKAQVEYTGTHPHHHMAPSIQSIGNGEERTDLLFDPCPSTGVHVTYSELFVSYNDASLGWVELTSANATTGACYAHSYTLPSTYVNLGYYFYLEYSDGTYEMETIDY